MKKINMDKKTFLVALASTCIVIIAVVFVLLPQFQPIQTVTDACVVGGCSNEICQGKNEEPIVTNCIYKEEFACYKHAKCEFQNDGACGWTPDKKLTSCIEKAKQ